MQKELVDNFYTSGWEFSLSDLELKSRYQMINIGMFLSTIVIIYAIIGNYVRHIEGFIPIETSIIVMNIIMTIALRKSRKIFEYVATIMTAQYTFLFLVIIYKGDPVDVKHTWFFTYSIILLYFQGSKKGLYWFIFLVTMLLIAPLQKFVEIKYTFYQVSYISFVLIIIYIIIHFYQVKMDEANALIKEQQNKLLEAENILRRELHHRTKNNMQFILSLFKLKLAAFMRPDVQRVVKEVTFKIKSMARAHDMLYAQTSLNNMDTSKYFNQLIDELKNGYETDRIAFDIKVETQLNGDQILYCGLIVNEMVINALKYAFDDEQAGVISLHLTKNQDQIILDLSDNGKGMDESKEDSFGSMMIKSLIEHELKGSMKLETKNGVRYTVTMPC